MSRSPDGAKRVDIHQRKRRSPFGAKSRLHAMDQINRLLFPQNIRRAPKSPPDHLLVNRANVVECAGVS
jgi:hypothetical protein